MIQRDLPSTSATVLGNYSIGTNVGQEQRQALFAWTPAKLVAMKASAEKVIALQDSLGRNSDGLPIAYIDPDIILSKHSLTPLEALMQTPPLESLVPLSYLEGFATTPDSLPFWERLDGEPLEYHALFRAYRDMLYPRLDPRLPYATQLGSTTEYDEHNTEHEPAEEPLTILEQAEREAQSQSQSQSQRKPRYEASYDIENPRSIKSLRSLYIVAQRANVSRNVIKVISNMYHWAVRVKAFDIYRKAQIELHRSFEVERMEGTHAKAARVIFDRCMDYLEDNLEQLDPKTALSWLQTAVELERLSLGLSPDKPGSGTGTGTNAGPVDMQGALNSFIQINQNTQIQAGIGASGENPHGTKGQRIQEILGILSEAKVIDVSTEGGERSDNDDDNDNTSARAGAARVTRVTEPIRIDPS